MQQEQIDRINALARKMRTAEGLTAEEKAEQTALRNAYVAAYRDSLRKQLDHTVILRPDGTKATLKKKDDKD